jgi:hypothetical protein
MQDAVRASMSWFAAQLARTEVQLMRSIDVAVKMWLQLASSTSGKLKHHATC